MNNLANMLPWSQEAEQSILGGLLLDCQRGFDRVQPLEPQHFFDARHGDIYRVIRQLIAKRQPVDVITVFESLRDEGKSDEAGGLPYLNSLAQYVPSAAHVHRYAAIIRDKAMRRALLEAADQALEVASLADGDMASKLDKITSLFGSLQRQQVAKVPRTLAEVALERTAHYEDLQAGRAISGWPTHLALLNIQLNGGLRPGCLYYQAARPGVGKTSLSLDIAAKAGLRTLFLSQEMTSEQLADRGVANVGRVRYAALQNGSLEPDDWARVVDAIESPSLKEIYIDDQGSLTLSDIRAKAKMVPGLQLLVLDYLQLCAGSAGAGANRNAEIEQISRGLKSLAKELGIAVLALSQLNRQVEQRTNKRPVLSDLRDSGSIEQDADAVMLLWPVRDLGTDAKLIGIDIAKNRQGRTGEIALHFNGETQTWGISTESLQLTGPRHESTGRRGLGHYD